MPIQRSVEEIQMMHSKVRQLRIEQFEAFENDYIQDLTNFSRVLSLTCRNITNDKILMLHFCNFLSELPSAELSGYMYIF